MMTGWMMDGCRESKSRLPFTSYLYILLDLLLPMTDLLRLYFPQNAYMYCTGKCIKF